MKKPEAIASLETLEPRVAFNAAPFEAHINFQPATSTHPVGYMVDSGKKFGARYGGQTYGWNSDVSSSAVDRHVLIGTTSGTSIGMKAGSKWEIAVPNGTYKVHVEVGDPMAVNSKYSMTIDGTPFISGTPTRKQHFFESTRKITVRDGRLTIANSASAANTKIDSIDLVALKSTVSIKAFSRTTPVQAHGGDIICRGGIYYWYGENKDGPTTTQPDLDQPRVDVIGVSVYASIDLHHWDYRGLALPAAPNGDLSAGNVLERPKVLYNTRTKKYVMWMHLDNATYTDSRVAVATSSSPVGPFVYRGSFKPLGLISRDMNVFQDDDGTAYLVFATDNNNSLRIAQMTSNYLALTGKSVTPFQTPDKREAPQLFKQGGVYYLLTSGATWFAPNAAAYAVSDTVLGKYKTMGNPVSGAGASTTYQSQGAAAFLDADTGRYMLLADRWNVDDLGASSYAFLPMTFSDGRLTLGEPVDWSLTVF